MDSQHERANQAREFLATNLGPYLGRIQANNQQLNQKIAELSALLEARQALVFQGGEIIQETKHIAVVTRPSANDHVQYYADQELMNRNAWPLIDNAPGPRLGAVMRSARDLGLIYF